MTAPTTLHIWGTKNHAYCVYRGNIRIHYRSVIGGVMTPPYNALQIISPLNYNLKPWEIFDWLFTFFRFSGIMDKTIRNGNPQGFRYAQEIATPVCGPARND